MPAQKRPHPPPSAAFSPSPAEEKEQEQEQRSEDDKASPQQEHGGSDGGEGEGSGAGAGAGKDEDEDEYMLVNLAEIRKEVQCPICLGIIRKTRTVMECLHRFCRECIDKSMRLGNNECPACRTHCASRRSLRDDANYDALISALYPDIDQYEKDDLAYHEEKRLALTRNRKLQASMTGTYRRQSEALARKKSSARATAAAFIRKSRRNFRSRGRSDDRDNIDVGSDEDRDVKDSANDADKDYSSVEECSSERRPKRCKRSPGVQSSPARASSNSEIGDEQNENLVTIREKPSMPPSQAGNTEILTQGKEEERSSEVRQKRCRRLPGARSLPPRTTGNSDISCKENDNLEMSKENLSMPPLQAGKGELLTWGKGGARSQTRHGHATQVSNLNTKFFKDGRIAKLMEHLRKLNENPDEFDVHLTLLPLDERSTPCLDQPYLCCRPPVSIRHLCQFIAVQTSVQAEKVKIFVRKAQRGTLAVNTGGSMEKANNGLFDDIHRLGADKSVGELHASFASNGSGLVLLYLFQE